MSWTALNRTYDFILMELCVLMKSTNQEQIKNKSRNQKQYWIRINVYSYEELRFQGTNETDITRKEYYKDYEAR